MLVEKPPACAGVAQGTTVDTRAKRTRTPHYWTEFLLQGANGIDRETASPPCRNGGLVSLPATLTDALGGSEKVHIDSYIAQSRSLGYAGSTSGGRMNRRRTYLFWVLLLASILTAESAAFAQKY